MRNRDIELLRSNVNEIVEMKDEFEKLLAKFVNDIISVEKELDKEYSLSHLMGRIRQIIEGVDTDEIFEFLEELESEVSTLDYKHKRMANANEMAMFPKTITPAYYRPRSIK